MTDQLLDRAKEVRRGEELDLVSVDPWIKANVPGLTGTPDVTQYSGGASNWTYCLKYAEREIILRRAPDGTKAKGAHDMIREHRLQAALKPAYRYVPEMLGVCEDKSILGTEFYIMEKLNGIIPRKNFPPALKLDPTQTNQICRNVLDCMIELHKVDHEAANLSHLGKGAGYTERQISGWSKRYAQARTWNVPSGKKVIQWLEDNIPQKEIICITHNDFRFDNVVLNASDPSEVIGVLDWELATLGDPLMDLGNTLAYWIEAGDGYLAQMSRRQPTHLEGMFTRKEVVSYYLEKTGFEVDDFTFYEVYGLFRLAGIIQQIYYRYHHKQTRNPAFKNMWLFSHYLLWRCEKAIRNQGR